MKTIEARLPRSRDCGGIARRVVEKHLGGRASHTALDDLKLVVSELVDNAYLHGRGEIHLKLLPRREMVRVEVIDDGEGAAVKIRRRGPGEPGGFGLKLVERLSNAWGAQERTTQVWAEVPLS